MEKIDLLIKVYNLVIKSGICAGTSLDDWKRIILQADRLGYLHCLVSNNEVNVACCAYRISEFKKEYVEKMPDEEHGDILYIVWMVSDGKFPFGLYKMLSSYRKVYNVSEVLYYERNDSKSLKRLKIIDNKMSNKIEDSK